MSAEDLARPPCLREDALAVLRRLREAGNVAYFAGGCVRDVLLKLDPKDYDVATDATPPRVRGLFSNTQAVGAAFGVILVRHGQSVIEVATFRTDLEYRDGRRPEGVQFATAQEDARRRDFTINGLFLDPIEDRVIDFVGGQEDLQARIVRAIGNADERFAEDHLRLLRAVRFAARLDFAIEPATAAAIKSHAHQLIRISPERIADELRRMLTGKTRGHAYRLLREFGLLPILLRFLPEKQTHRSEETFSIFMALSSICPGAVSFGLSLAVITLEFRMHATGKYDPGFWLTSTQVKRAAAAVRQALKISNEELAEMTGALAFNHVLTAEPTVAALKRFLAQQGSDDATMLMAAIAKCGMLVNQIGSVLQSLDRWRQTEFAPAPLITGDDLTGAGARPGPIFKRALDAAYDAQLEDRIHSREQAMELAMKIVSEHKTG
jgi:poly(A) polymerase